MTLPTTTYRTRRVFPRNTLPADYYSVNPQHPHWPLVIMLVLTQLSVGAFVVGLLLQWLLPVGLDEPWSTWHTPIALVFGIVALASSTLHLGRPHLAYRAIIGIRHSWLSREIVAFGLFAGLACAQCATSLSDAGWLTPARTALEWSVAGIGIVAVFCSAMIYVATQRECWSFSRVAIRFGLSTCLLGAMATCFTIVTVARFTDTDALHHVARDAVAYTLRVLIVVSAAKLLYEAAVVSHLASRRMTAVKRSALLMTRQLSGITLARFALGLLGGIGAPLLLRHVADAGPVEVAVMLTMMLAGCLFGELLERYLFFAAAANVRMPGAIR
ncbi:MAG: DmsC/YnfH family molybdoenzyme membrane anchor subunit [Pirellulales bacterium]